MLYQLNNLTKVYGERAVLDLSLSLDSGKVIGLLGPNGSGKTTLLELLAFLLPPTSGEICYRGSRIDMEKTDMTGLRRSVVLVQQSPALFTASVSRNVEFPMKIRHVAQSTRKETVRELLRLVGMEAFSHARAHKLSGGETQRVAIAQALACDPDVILLDEPTANVDVENQIIIERIIRDINRQNGMSVIFTTHDVLQASRLSDDLVSLHEGRISGQAHENIFSGHIRKNTNGKVVCAVGNDIEIPLKTDKTGPVRIAIDPRIITIARAVEEAWNQDEAIKGKLIQLTDQMDAVRALVDVGVPLSVLMTKSVIGKIDPKIGEDVWVTIIPDKVSVLAAHGGSEHGDKKTS